MAQDAATSGAIDDIIHIRGRTEEAKENEIASIIARRHELIRELFMRHNIAENLEAILQEQTGIRAADEAALTEFSKNFDLSRQKNSRLVSGHPISEDTISVTPKAGDGKLEVKPPVDPASGPNLSRRRTLPPVERMVTRGISAKKLALSPDTPAVSSPTPNSAIPASVITTPGPSRRRSSASNQRSAAALATPSNQIMAHPIRRTTQRTEATPQVRKQSPQKAPSKRPKGDAQLEGYRWYEWQLRVQANPLAALLPTASKALSTSDWQAARDEAQQMRILQKVEDLKEQKLWSFRQLKPHTPPRRPKTHWDMLLEEMKWMRVDFRQERKWKIAVAYTIAHWVMEWHAASDKASLCVPRTPLSARKLASADNMIMDSGATTTRSNAEDDDCQDDKPAEPLQSEFMDVDTSTYRLDGADSDNSEVPIYGPPNLESDQYFEDENQHHLIVPISKYATERVLMVLDSKGDSWEGIKEEGAEYDVTTSSNNGETPSHTPSVSTLFSNPSTADERPIPAPDCPTERASTVTDWTKEEDIALMSLAISYQYNWRIISDMLFSEQPTGIRCRRSEWDCYRRYKERASSSRGMNSTLRSENAFSGPFHLPSSAESKSFKIERQFMAFDTIRDIRKNSRNKDKSKSPGERKPPAKILLSTHETHYSSQSNAGIDPTAPALSPAELAILRRNRQAQENGRHHPYGPRAGLMIGRQMSSGAIPLPYQYRPPARPSPSMSTLQGSPALANAGTNVQHSTIRPPPTPVMAQMPVQSASPMLRTNGAPPHMAQEVRAFLQRQHQLMAPPQQRTASSPQPGQSSNSMQQPAEAIATQVPGAPSLTIQATTVPNQLHQHLVMARQHRLQQQTQQVLQQAAEQQQIQHQQSNSQPQLHLQRQMPTDAHAHTAAAFVALQNAKMAQAAQMTPEMLQQQRQMQQARLPLQQQQMQPAAIMMSNNSGASHLGSGSTARGPTSISVTSGDQSAVPNNSGQDQPQQPAQPQTSVEILQQAEESIQEDEKSSSSS